MIFAFIDESDHPHPNDSSDRPTLAAVCVDADRLRELNTLLFGLKRDLLGRSRFGFEIKASELITRGMLRDHPAEREFVESFFFNLCGDFPMSVFAIVMERPKTELSQDSRFLPRQFRFMLQRVNALAESETDRAVVMFDGDGSQLSNLAERFSNWIFRSESGRALASLAESPFFVDSKFTPGIQVADMIAGVIRIYHEKRLNEGIPPGDAFLSDIARYYEAIRRKSVNLTWKATGEELYGIYFMPERFHRA